MLEQNVLFVLIVVDKWAILGFLSILDAVRAVLTSCGNKQEYPN